MDRFDLAEQKLINDFQHAFPCCSRPYQQLGDALGLSEVAVIEKLKHLTQAGIISRIGPVFSPGRIGCSTLAALAVPVAELDAVADGISALPEANHNYQRSDQFNLWFVLTASDPEHLASVLRKIREAYPWPLLNLPLLEQFHIDLGFNLASTRKTKRPRQITHGARLQLTRQQTQLISKLQSGIPLAAEPYADLWSGDEAQADWALAQIAQWQEDGIIKRFGIIVRHHELGYRENAMVVWDVPDERVQTYGQRAAKIPEVTLCYRRPRQLPEWPYNLFCMIHGKDRTLVEKRIADLCQETGLSAFPMKTLFSTRRFKQRGARYVSA